MYRENIEAVGNAAGSELFTGNNLIMTVGWLDKKITLVSMLKLWFYCYLGNLIGALYWFASSGQQSLESKSENAA